MTDFSQPGSDGALPDGVPEWREGLGSLTRRGLVYTSRGATSVLPCDQTYRITAGFKQKIAKGGSLPSFAGVYRRAARLVEARAAEMSCAHGEPLHARILGHTWTCLPGSSFDFPMASVVTELGCARKDRAVGEPEPTPSDLTLPGGTPPEQFSPIVSRPSNEFFSEYDTCGELSTNPEPISFSYGEHVETCSGLDFAPFVEQAERRARIHHKLLAGLSGQATEFTVLRRDWWAVPDTLVVVVVYFEG